MKILVTPTSLQPGENEIMLDKLRRFSDDLVFNPAGRPLKDAELRPLLSDCDGYIAGLDYVTEEALSDCTHLKVISRYGSGYDRVDLKAAKQKGIVVTNTPGVNAEAVGELAFGMALAVARKIPYLNAKIREGEWIRSTGMELFGKTLAILGLGAVGKVMARCAAGFGMHVIAYDPFIDEKYCEENGIRSVTFEEAMQWGNVISLHLPLLPETEHMINSSAFSMMQKGTILVNTSRGGIIDEQAACEALQSGWLGGLALDTFESEPPGDSPLFAFSNVVATPHTGAHTLEATNNMAEAAVQNLIDVLDGKECLYIVNP